MKSLSEEKKPVLRLNKVCKRFGGVVAAEDITFELFGGDVFGLIGPNGSGKTTLINLITGIYSKDSGEIYLHDKNITKLPTHKISQLRVIRTFQNPRLLERCDIRTNIMLGVDLANKIGIHNETSIDENMAFLLENAGLGNINLDDSIEKLSYGQQKLLEIVRALLCEPLVLLMDEPAAGLNNKEMEYIVNLINIATRKGTAVLLIEHAMDLVMSICNRITVLNFGHQIAIGTPDEVQQNQAVIEAYLGGGRRAEN